MQKHHATNKKAIITNPPIIEPTMTTALLTVGPETKQRLLLFFVSILHYMTLASLDRP